MKIFYYTNNLVPIIRDIVDLQADFYKNNMPTLTN